MTFSISGTVAGEDVRFEGFARAVDALRKYRELQATGQVSALWIYHGERQITVEELIQLAHER